MRVVLLKSLNYLIGKKNDKMAKKKNANDKIVKKKMLHKNLISLL